MPLPDSSQSSVWLSDAEVADATRRTYPAAQARVLKAWKVPFKRRPDGTLLVGRAAIEAALALGGTTPARASSGLNWSKAA